MYISIPFIGSWLARPFIERGRPIESVGDSRPRQMIELHSFGLDVQNPAYCMFDTGGSSSGFF